MGEMGYPRYLRLFRGEQSVEKLVAKYLTGDDNVGSGGDSPGAGAPREIGHGASSVGAWNPECWRGCAEQDRIPGTFVTRERGAILDGGSLRKHPLEQLPCVAHVALAAAPQGLLSARKPVAEGTKQMQEIESNLHLFQPPRYRASDGSWHATYGNALAQSAPELTLDGAAVLSLLSFNFVCGDRTLLHEIRRRPWLSSIGPKGLPVLSSIPEHDLHWQSYERIAEELGRLLCDEAFRVCRGRREIYVLLSGGIDSRIVAATLSRLVDDGRLPNKPVALTWGLPDSRDYQYGRETARILGLEWVHADLGPEHLRQNLPDTAELLGALVSPIHLHRMTWFRTLPRDALVLAGNYGDMVGRAEFSGRRLLELRPLVPTNPFGLLRREILEAAADGLRSELNALHARSPGKPTYVLCEHEMHGHYTRSLIAHAMSVIDHFCSVYQMFTDPRVYSYMWSLHPSLRADEVYAVLIRRLHPNLARLPWARTNRALRGRTVGARAGLRREFHDYAGWISGPLYEEFVRRVDPDWCAGTGLFDADRVRDLSRLACEDPDGAARPDAVSPFKIFAWLACFRHFVEWAEAQGKRLRLDPGGVRPATYEVSVPYDPIGKLGRLLQNLPAVRGAVRAARLGLLRYEARLRYRPRS